MNSIKYYLAITDHFITTLANNVNEELGNNRYEVPSAISNFYQRIKTLTIEEHILDDDLGSSGDYEPIKNKF